MKTKPGLLTEKQFRQVILSELLERNSAVKSEMKIASIVGLNFAAP